MVASGSTARNRFKPHNLVAPRALLSSICQRRSGRTRRAGRAALDGEECGEVPVDAFAATAAVRNYRCESATRSKSSAQGRSPEWECFTE
jgi:hypothetical protein